jgi:uncharacterized protein YaiL (DUF2058 family)
MAKSLQEQLMGSGLVDKKQAKQIQKEKRQKRKQTPKGLLQEEAIQKQDLVDQQKQEKAEKDRELNRLKKAEQDKKAIKAQIIQLIQTNKIERQNGEIGFQFAVNKQIKKLYIDNEQQGYLLRGKLAITQLGNEFYLVPTAVAEKIAQRDDAAVVYLETTQVDTHESAEDDPYKDFVIPDDLMW